MHISKLSLVNYRNFSAVNFYFNKGINTIIGENGSGKTNAFRAIRLLLDPTLPRSASKLVENDFNRGLDNWKGHWIIISLEFDEISQDEAIQSLFTHSTGIINYEDKVNKATYNLLFRPNQIVRKSLSQLQKGDEKGLKELQKSISLSDYEPVITGRSSADFTNEDTYKNIVGDFNKVIFPATLDSNLIGSKVSAFFNLYDDIAFTFIKALRDVVSDFHSSRKNPLLTLLKAKSGEIVDNDLEEVIENVERLNTSIEELDSVKDIRDDIFSTIKDTAGDTYSPSRLSIKSDLSDNAEELFQSLSLHIGESYDDYEGPIHELSLGGANLIFLTLKILEFKYQQGKELFANFLLIEEPEAHIHTHIQKTLFDKVQYDNTQIIYTTHSTHISDVSNVESMNIIGKTSSSYEVFQPTKGLKSKQIRAVQRYLDAIRSNLLFAKSVILVEGDAEEILIPELVKKILGLSLDELGISLVNVRSTGFENVANLFHNNRIRKKCAIITDFDSIFFNIDIAEDDSPKVKKQKKKAAGSAKKGRERKASLDTYIGNNDWLDSFYAVHTFEVDFIKEGNVNCYIDALNDIYTDRNTIIKSKIELSSNNISDYGVRALKMANYEGKGWFAIQLAERLTYECIVPQYIAEAINSVNPEFTHHLLSKIIRYRMSMLRKQGRLTPELTRPVAKAWKEYISDNSKITKLLKAFKKSFPNDSSIIIWDH
ncbi:AAA family ATPase [Aliivibrio fischeri]|uniref:ATP-dependent nuclease n=1 Tax=Aliivibrio fischeri TaxID=668 RepID=UPI0012D89E77|nr:AAA family ATPase [Aliivibrio fischeri]MUK66313.1 AAA family ATPase [Aliivibrio fischeri]MUK91800.1 AAA family ATPase [Aliivibrio fischeri]